MVKIDIISGFLGAGKTTLIRKLIKEAYSGQKLALIENEFGQVSVDGGFLQEAGIEIKEMNSGCICCSLVGDFGIALQQVIDQYQPERILIEPSGVAGLSDVIAAVKKVTNDQVMLGNKVAVADATKCRLYAKNFGAFYKNQIENADTIVVTRTDIISQDKLQQALHILQELNTDAAYITTPITDLSGKQLREAMDRENTLDEELQKLKEETHNHSHHDHDDECGCGHQHHDHDEDCGCGEHHHDHDEECGCGEHHHDHDEDCGCGDHHHDHDEECCCGEHHHDHHHDHDEDCGCGDHHHDHDEECGCGHHHHDHDADDVFSSWGTEIAKKFTKSDLSAILEALEEENKYGMILRAKGIVESPDGGWVHFDYVPGETDIRSGSAAVTGRICVIGAQLREAAIAQLFEM